MKKWQDSLIPFQNLQRMAENCTDKRSLGQNLYGFVLQFLDEVRHDQAKATWEDAIKEVVNTYKRENPSLYEKYETWWKAKIKRWGIKLW